MGVQRFTCIDGKGNIQGMIPSICVFLNYENHVLVLLYSLVFERDIAIFDAVVLPQLVVYFPPNVIKRVCAYCYHYRYHHPTCTCYHHRCRYQLRFDLQWQILILGLPAHLSSRPTC